MELSEMHKYLVEYEIATEDEIELVSNINGYTRATMTDILYSKTGYNTFDQQQEEMEDMEYDY